MFQASLNNNSKAKDLNLIQQNSNLLTINTRSRQKMKVVGVTDPYLTQAVIQKMLTKILNEKKWSKIELSQALNITVKELNLLFIYKAPSWLIVKINLPVINLFCETKL